MSTSSLKISSEQVAEVISDLELIDNSRAKIFFVVDPFEVVEFCFPIDPDRESGTDIEQLADNQAALFEVFYNRPEPAVLLPEYAKEIKAYLDFLTRTTAEVYSKLELFESLDRKADLDLASPEFLAENAELIDYLQNHFGVLLAVKMGIDSLGLERLLEVRKRLKLIEEVEKEPASKALIEEFVLTYRPSQLAKDIKKYLMSEVTTDDPYEHLRRERAAVRDAHAIDFLINLNKKLERAYLSKPKQLSQRLVFLYLSSAPKSQRIFGLDWVKQSLPTIEGRKRSILRTKAQVFAYAFSKSRVEDESDERKRTINNLSAYRALVEEFEKIQKDPSEYTGQKKQEVIEGLRKKEEELKSTGSGIENLGLFLRIETYNKVLTSHGAELVKLAKDKLVQVTISQVTNLFRTASDNRGLEDLALRRMYDLQGIVLTLSEFAVPATGKAGPAAPDQTQDAAEDKSLSQEEPCNIPSAVRIKDPFYVGIFELLRTFSKLSGAQKEKRAHLFREAYLNFCSREGTSECGPLRPAEHELTRCLLYLTLPPKEGCAKAIDHAIQQAPLYPQLKLEFDWVRSWALANLGRYAEADQLIQEMIAEDDSDARFPLWHALNISAWRSKDRNAPYGMIDAIEATLQALALYQQEGNEARVGLAHNNLAYYYSCDPEDPSFSLPKAREHLEELQRHVTKEQWTPDHPEFFHTEANLLFQEFLQERQNGGAPERLASLWQQARDAISAASKIVNKPSYGELTRKIKAERPSRVPSARSSLGAPSEVSS
jgi:hypothetical protein